MITGKILIGITSKNRATILPKAISSGISQLYFNKEIAVFDDNSSDDTKLLLNQFPEITWFFSENPKGYLYARNQFLKNTDAEYFCSLDDDSWFLDNTTLIQAVDFMNNNKSVGALAFDILTPDSPNGCFLTDEIKESNNFIGCGHMLRVDAVKKVGYYTPNPGFYGVEEKDLCLRLIDKGYSIMRFPHVKIWHEKSNISRDLKKQHRSGVCNDFVFMWRRTPAIYLFPAILNKLYSNATFPFRYKNIKFFLPFLQGIYDFINALVSNKINRDPVSKKGLIKFLKLNK